MTIYNPPAGVGGDWGSIGGNIADQTDLQTILLSKIESAKFTTQTVYDSIQDIIGYSDYTQVISFDDSLGTPASRQINLLSSDDDFSLILVNSSSVSVMVFNHIGGLDLSVATGRTAYITVSNNVIYAAFGPSSGINTGDQDLSGKMDRGYLSQTPAGTGPYAVTLNPTTINTVLCPPTATNGEFTFTGQLAGTILRVRFSGATTVTMTSATGGISIPPQTIAGSYMYIYTGSIWSQISSTNAYLNDINQYLSSSSSPTFVKASVDSVQLDTTPLTGTVSEGEMKYDSDNGVVMFGLSGGVTWQGGMENFKPVKADGETLGEGKVVMYSGTDGNSGHYKAKLFINDGTYSPLFLIGIITTSGGITNGNFGKATWDGLVHGIQTDGANYGETWLADDLLYCSTSTPGALTNIKPNDPYYDKPVAVVMSVHASNGIIGVRISPQTNGHQPYHGVVTNTNVSSFDGDTTVYTMPATSEWSAYINGQFYRFNSPKTVTLSASADWSVTEIDNYGQWFIYMHKDLTLRASKTPWNLLDLDIIPIDTLYLQNGTITNYEGIRANEYHSYNRNLVEHNAQHQKWGAQYVSGFNSITIGTGAPNNSTNTFSLTGGVIADEDLFHTIANPSTSARIGYRNSAWANKMQFNISGAGYAILNGTAPRYDNAGTLTDISVGSYGVSWVYATNRKTAGEQIVIILGQGEYISVSAAQAAAQPSLVGLSVAEWKLLYRVIYRNIAGNINWIQSDPLYNLSTGPAIQAGAISTISAGSVVLTPSGGISANNVQSAIEELDSEKANLSGATFTGDVIVPDDAYDEATWNGNNEVPTKNSVRDKIETLISASSVTTLSNKRIVQRITSIVSSATPSVNTDDCDAVTITALATDITSMTSSLTGTPNNFDRLVYRIKDDGSPRTISWGASFESKGATLPTTTVAGKLMTVGFIYDSVTSKWGCVALSQEV